MFKLWELLTDWIVKIGVGLLIIGDIYLGGWVWSLLISSSGFTQDTEITSIAKLVGFGISLGTSAIQIKIWGIILGRWEFDRSLPFILALLFGLVVVLMDTFGDTFYFYLFSEGHSLADISIEGVRNAKFVTKFYMLFGGLVFGGNELLAYLLLAPKKVEVEEDEPEPQVAHGRR